MEDRPFEFVYNSVKIRPLLQEIINDNYLYMMTDPAFYIRKLQDYVSDVSKRLKQMNVNEDQKHDKIAVRNLAVGISAGYNDF